MVEKQLDNPAQPSIAVDAGRQSPIVKVCGVTRHYGDLRAVDELSFEVHRGEIFGFIGPNGAGKTTTLKMIATLIEPSGGQVLVDGFCVENDTIAVRRLIGYMPDHFGVYDGNTVEEYLEFFAGAYQLPRQLREPTVRDVMALTDLLHLKDRLVSELSKGMKQRLCLAKTLVHDPEVLLLDEPASALDPRARIEFRELLKELRSMGKTIIISSHILTELSDVCDSVAVIEKGKLVGSGRVGDLQKKNQAADVVRIELSRSNAEVEAVLGELTSVGSVIVSGHRVQFDYFGSPHDFYLVLKVLVERSVEVLSVEYNPRNLEHLFLELTKGDVQ